MTVDSTLPSTTQTRRRGCLPIIARLLKWIGLLLLVLIVIGVTYQLIATESAKNTYLAPGQLYTVNGHQIHLYCTGEENPDAPTVILEAGGISYSREWYWVQDQLDDHVRVCSYDRAGTGWSEASPEPRSALQITNELNQLLDETGVSGQLILAGHSYGGVINRVYAAQYPEQVEGIVLVDTAFVLPESFADQAAYDQWKRENDLLQAVVWAANRVGIYRLSLASELAAYGYPSEIAAELAALRGSNQSFDTYYAEGILERWSLAEQSASAQNLGDLPLIALWADAPQGTPQAMADRLRELQDEVLTYSTQAEARYLLGASHGSIVGDEHYARQVSDAILELVNPASQPTETS